MGALPGGGRGDEIILPSSRCAASLAPVIMVTYETGQAGQSLWLSGFAGFYRLPTEVGLLLALPLVPHSLWHSGGSLDQRGRSARKGPRSEAAGSSSAACAGAKRPAGS